MVRVSVRALPAASATETLSLTPIFLRAFSTLRIAARAGPESFSSTLAVAPAAILVVTFPSA